MIAGSDDKAGGPARLYGRRQGRPLRVGKRRLLDETLPTLAVALDAAAPGSLDPAHLFPAASEVWLEIGFGGGEHLADQAERHPDIGFIGAEPFVNGVAALLKTIEASGIANVRVLMDDVRPLLAALAPQSIGRAFILFPDPWPKRRHWKRRIVCRPVLDQLARVVKPGAELRLATDHEDYGQWMLLSLIAHPEFAWTAQSATDWCLRPADQAKTRYESKARADGRKPLFLVARRRS